MYQVKQRPKLRLASAIIDKHLKKEKSASALALALAFALALALALALDYCLSI